MPKSTKMRRQMRSRLLALLIILVILLPLGLWYTWYGLSNKPIVDYTFGQSKDVRPSYHLIASSPTRPGTIDITHVLVRNRGSADISVIVTVHAVNAVVSTSYDGPYNDMAGELISLPANSGDRVVTYYFTLITQVSGFTFQVDVNKNVDYSSLPSSAAAIFGDTAPIFPTLLQYAQEPISLYDYQLSPVISNSLQ